MKKKTLGFLILILTLSGCDGNVISSSESISTGLPSLNIPTNEDLAKTEENYVVYENKQRLESIGGSSEAPDPFVYRFNGWYYLYPTTNGGRQKAYKSQDLIYWEPVSNGVNGHGYVYEYQLDPNKPDSSTPFAPEVIYYNGMFYMISSPSGNGHYIFQSESPEGPFEAITGNIGRSIDGSFFIDKDEQVYMYGASNGGMVVYAMENDMVSFKENDNGTNKQLTLEECKVADWNEGPYMLQRNGLYYLTYCGSHYLSKSYRVDYAYAKEGANLLSSTSYVREDTVLVSTKDDFNGLGHSSTVLAPDMDSYMIVYHDLNKDSSRNLDVSRLSFNGSMMVANSVKTENAIGVDIPPFCGEDDTIFTEKGNFLLSDNATEEDFTVEFNNIGEGKMIFSYVDDQNYSYIEFKNNDILINTIQNGTDTNVHTIDLINEYYNDVYHTYRLQYRDGLMNFYFDSMEKEAGLPANFKPGKMGYLKDNQFDEIGYSAFSNVALGSSDSKYYADTVSLANGFDEKLSYFKNGYEMKSSKKSNYVQEDNYNLVLKTEGDFATYRMYAAETGYYNINIRIPYSSLNKKIGYRVDGGEVNEKQLSSSNLKYEKGDVYLNLGEVYIEAGAHNISICNVGDEIAFSKICYEEALYGNDIEEVFNKQTYLDKFDCYDVSNTSLTNDGLLSDYQPLQAVVSKEEYSNYSFEATVQLRDLGNTLSTVGIMFNVTDFSRNYKGDGDGDGGNNPNMFRGYRLAFKPGEIVLEHIDFNFSRTLKTKTFRYEMDGIYTLGVDVVDNQIVCYLDGEVVFTVDGNIGNLNGKVGIESADSDVIFKTFTVISN